MAFRRKINGLLYVGRSLSFSPQLFSSLWICLFLQMVSVMLHLIKTLKRGPVQLNISLWFRWKLTMSPLVSAYVRTAICLRWNVQFLVGITTQSKNILFEFNKSVCSGFWHRVRSGSKTCDVFGRSSVNNIKIWVTTLWHFSVAFQRIIKTLFSHSFTLTDTCWGFHLMDA